MAKINPDLEEATVEVSKESFIAIMKALPCTYRWIDTEEEGPNIILYSVNGFKLVVMPPAPCRSKPPEKAQDAKS